MKPIVVILISLAVAGCGFYLKGTRPLPPALQSLQIKHDQPYRVVPPPLIDALEQRLRQRDALADGQAAATLHIIEVKTEQRVLSVSPVDGRAVEFELIASTEFELLEQGKRRVSPQSVGVQRAYSFDNTERLAAATEQRDLLAAMQAELADLILLRLEAALSQAP